MNDIVGRRRMFVNSASSTVSRTTNTEKEFVGRRKIRGVLFSVVCGLCVVLSLLCACLVTFIVLLGHRYDVSNGLIDSRSRRNVINMPLREGPDGLTFRLPTEVRPIHYDLYLHPDLAKGTFKGRVTIVIDVAAKRSFIALHQKELNITSTKLVTIDREENWELQIKEAYEVAKLEAWIVSTKQEIPPGLYNLTLEFDGALQPNKIVGFYSSTYKDAEQRTRLIATSKFEPTYARRAFPCFDEPAFKAEFSVKIVQPSNDGYISLSNMNTQTIVPNEPKLGLTTVTFAKSVPMSTYLVCFIVSDLVPVTATAKGLSGKTFPVSVYTTLAQQAKGAFALDIGVKAIQYYINLFNIDYPLPKLDMAAIPDFVSGAMENWGLVTYREARLLYDSKTSSAANMKDIATVVCHEFAHMWFGNLVTMAWWNDLWLNEGFATYMQFKSSNALLPDWGMMDQFLIDEVHPVLTIDATLSSHPIVQTVSNPDEITSIFDVISYNKGASVLRMLESFIGSDIFYEGVSTYLTKHAYQNAETADLFGILQDAIGDKFNVTSIMDTWTRQMGFPVVNVVRNGSAYTLTQKRFLADPEKTYNSNDSNYGYKWTIPITYITSCNSTPTLVWLDKDANSLTIDIPTSVNWVKFNKDQIGYYRVNYETEEWQKISRVLSSNHETLSVSDRTHLLEDGFSLADATELDYDIVLDMTSYLSDETHYVPWSVATSKLTGMYTLLASTNLTESFRNYIRDLVGSTYRATTLRINDDETHIKRQLRMTVADLACRVGLRQCISEVSRIFTAWINDPEDVRPHADIRGLVYYYGMNSVGGEAEWNIMFERFMNETDAREKLKLMYGLSGIRESWILSKFLNLAFDEKYVRSQDYFSCVTYIAQNPIGSALVWDWVRENWQLLVNRYTLNNRYLGRLIPGISRKFATNLKLEEMKAFFNRYPEAGAGATYRAQALEAISNNIKWLRNNAGKIEAWLHSRSQSH